MNTEKLANSQRKTKKSTKIPLKSRQEMLTDLLASRSFRTKGMRPYPGDDVYVPTYVTAGSA